MKKISSKKNAYRNQQETQLYDKITKIETKIIDKLSSIKKNKKNYQCKHLQTLNQKCQPYDKKINYYDKFWKTFLINQISNQRIGLLQTNLDELNKKLNQIEALFNKHYALAGENFKKKNRRPTDQIQKMHQCPYLKCFKTYGSQVSLNLHIKLKHKGGNKTDREKAAQLTWQARQKGKPVPQFYINLPPGFIQQYGYMTYRLKRPNQQQENNHGISSQ